MSNSMSETPSEGRHENQPRRLSWKQRPRLTGLCVVLFIFGPVLLLAAREAGRKTTSDGGNGTDAGATKDVDLSGTSNSPDATSAPATLPSVAPPTPAFMRSTPAYDPSREEPIASAIRQLQSMPAGYLLDPEREIEEAQSLWTELDQKARRWDAGPSQLLSPLQSRKLVSEARCVTRLIEILDRDRPSVRDAEAMEKRLAAFREAFQQIRVEGRSPSADFRRDLKIFRDELKFDCLIFLRDDKSLEYLVNSANAEADDGIALEDAIQAARQDIAADALKTLIQEFRKETPATEEKLLEEVKRAARKEKQPHLAAVRKKREQVQQEKQRVEEEQAAQALARQQETEMLRLKKRFEIEYPEMEKYLVGFTTNGYRQFIGSSLRTVTKAGPLSYLGMIHAGVLNDGVPSVELFHGTIGSTSSNDRDLGAFPRWEGGRQDFENKFPRLLTIQKFVREFGPVMVKEKLLSP